jgi:hypothetical protein
VSESPEIAALAKLVSDGLKADERRARGLAAWADGSGRADGGAFEFKFLMGNQVHGPFGGQTAIRNWATGQDLASLANPDRVRAAAAGARTLLDMALSWEHEMGPGGGFCGREYLANAPCDCGRDTRVLAVLTALAAPYQEET